MSDGLENEYENTIQKINEEGTHIQTGNGEDQYVEHGEMEATSKEEVALVTEQTRTGKKDRYVQNEEIETANKAELESVTETGNGEDQYVEHGEMEATSKAEVALVTETGNGEDQYVEHGEMEATSKEEVALVTEQTRTGKKGRYVQNEEIETANKAELESVTEIKDGEKDHHDEEKEAANIVKLASVTEIKQLATSASQTSEEYEDYDHGINGASFHQSKEATQNSEIKQLATTASQTSEEYEDYDNGINRASFHQSKEATQNSEIFAYIEHLITLMSEQQKPQQDQQLHILQQLLDMKRELYVQQNHKDDQQRHQQDLLLQLKEYQNTQLKLSEDLLQQITILIQQQNNLISGQIQQQQQDFQAKLMKDLAKQTKEQVQVLLQTSNKCETRQTSYNKGPSCGKSSFAFTTDPPNAFSGVAMPSGYSQDQGSFSQESFTNVKVQRRDTQGSNVFSCETVGLEFCNVFYPLWNSQNPSDGQRENIFWGPHLFWENATAEMIHFANGQQVLYRYEGFQCVNDFLLNLTSQEGFEFKPSMDNERFKCVNSKHGLVVVAVTGIILREGRSFGIFEQRFGLIQCPETRNFRIKFTILKTEYFNHMENVITAPALNYTTEQLENTVCEKNN
ncbi:uncharacterized protein LOC143981910 isoform X7 [Lithobates pipiens]